MAKEQLHNWGRYVFLAIVVIFGTGGWVFTVRDNTKDIVVLQEDTKLLQADVHKLELSDKDIAALAQTSVNLMSRIDTSLDDIAAEQTKITNEQTKQAVIQAVNSEKLKTLTKE